MNNTNPTESFKSPKSTLATSTPLFVGFNLADFSLTPVVRKGESDQLINTKHTHQWTGITQGRKREFFIERSYGNVAPNAYTEDFLLLLATMAFQRDNPSEIPVSANALLKVQGYTSLPGGDNISRVFEHLDALSETRLHTNALYNRDTSKWYSFKGSPVGGFTYMDEEGKFRSTFDKEGREIKVIVRELGTASITPEFYNSFLQDCIKLDITKYFHVGGPTARRLYKMGAKYINTLGDFEIDLQECCVTRLGMLPDVVLKNKVSKLASDIRPQAKRVTEADNFSCTIEPSQTPSGYKICFRKNVSQVALPGIPKVLEGSEKTAHRELTTRGVNSALAYELVLEARRRHGRRAERFISFVLRTYDKEKTTGKVGVGVIKHRIMNPVFFDPTFADHLQELRIREGKRDSKRYAEGLSHIGDLFGKATPDEDELNKMNPSLLERVRSGIDEQYTEDKRVAYGLGPDQFIQMKDRALRHYVSLAVKELKNGNADFDPFKRSS